MKKKVLDWLNKTGYPLELFVISQLQKQGYSCGKSELYQDLESEAAREIDVTAYKHGEDYKTYSYCIKLIIECKKSEKPLLNLCENNTRIPVGSYQLMDGDPEDGPPVDTLAYIKLREIPSEQLNDSIGGFASLAPMGYSVVPAFGKSDNQIFSGLMGLAKASTYYRRLFLEFFNKVRSDKSLHIQDRNPFELQMAVLVVDAPLFDVNLDDMGSLCVAKSDWSVVRVLLPWNINPYETGRGYCIHIVAKERFPQFLKDIDIFHKYISQPSVVSPMLIGVKREGMTSSLIRSLRSMGRSKSESE